MHVVGHSLASSMHLISLDKATLKRIIFLELVISGCFIIAKNRGDSKVFRTSVKNNSCRLWCWRSHPNSSKINSVISAVQWNLQLQIVSIINCFISSFADQLSGMSVCMCSSFIINLIYYFIINFVINCLILLGQICDMLLSYWFSKLSSLFCSKYRVICFFSINKEICFEQTIFICINHKCVNINCIWKLYVIMV